MKNRFYLIIACLLVVCAAFTSCKNTNEPVASQTDVVILDMDLGSSTDDLVTFDLALKLHDSGKIKLLGVICDRMGELHAQTADIYCTYYNHPEMPIGLERAGVDSPLVYTNYSPFLDTLTDGNGNLMFKRSITDYSQLPDGYKLYRKLLASADDNSVNIISCGFVTCLSRLLTSGADEYSSLGGAELVRQKVKCLYIQGGYFTEEYDGEPNYNFLQAEEFTKTFFDNWPTETPIIFNSMEAGNNINYEQDSLIKDMSWTDIHPTKQIYMGIFVDGFGQRMWDVLGLFCLEDPSLFHLSEPGTVTLDAYCASVFTPSADGKHRYIKSFTEAEEAQMLERIRERVRNLNK